MAIFSSKRKRKKKIPRTAIKLYWEKWWNLRQLAEHYGCAESHVLAQFRTWNIPTRPKQISGAYKPSKLTKHLKATERVWMACALDSEGSINCELTKYGHCALMIANTVKAFCDRATEITGCGKTLHNGKDYWRWQVTGRFTVEAILQEILPYLIVKKTKAEETLKWIDTWRQAMQRPYWVRVEAM